MTPDVAAVQAQIKAEFPTYQAKNKADVWWMKALGWVLGAQFMSGYVTTIGNTMYLPSDWSAWSAGIQCAVLRHEWTHMKQAKSLTYPLYAFLYLMAFFPIGLAYARACFEYEAYSVQMQAWKDYGLDYSSDVQINWLVAQFTTGTYGWMWPFPKTVMSWFKQSVTRLT